MVINALDYKIQLMGKRIRELREIEGLSIEEMAELTDVSAEHYLACEAGEADLTFAFIYRCALALNVNATEIIEGTTPRLDLYTVTRRGEGQQINKAHGMTYFSLAGPFKNRIAEPLLVCAAYDPEAQYEAMELTTHKGQECDIVISGQLKVQVGEHEEILGPGDSIYFNSEHPHGERAVNGEDCYFYAIVLNPMEEVLDSRPQASRIPAPRQAGIQTIEPLWSPYIDVAENENGTPISIRYKNTDNFNFAYDILDVMAEREPARLAMLHLDQDKKERRFTFADMSRLSCRCANYFKALGIEAGDRVMLCLKRHYQFWPILLGLNRIGAIAVPATNLLMEKDFDYCFSQAEISAIICTADGETLMEAERAGKKYPQLKLKIAVESRGGSINNLPGDWRDFNSEYSLYRSSLPRSEDTPGGIDSMLFFFTSGTSGNPKMAMHSHNYPLGHFHTARYWHNVDPDGLHVTVADTGWAKALWGKLYGQWLCGAAVLVYDFDRFDAADLLPLISEHQVTTFCAPPTIWRLMMKEDLSRYDLSSIKHASTAGEALNPEVFRQIESQTGIRIMEGFGQSESTVMIGNLTGDQHKFGSMGKPIAVYPVDIVDEDGESVTTGETGEIVIRTQPGEICGLFTGYYREPEQTDKVWHDGLYHTGDTAWRDEDGYYWYVGRLDDVIKSSGYRIGPFEIESVIMELPYVVECGVSSEPDPERGQLVKASIVLTDGTEGTDELKTEIQNYVKQKTAPYKYPRIVVFRDSLPKTTSGKIIRQQL